MPRVTPIGEIKELNSDELIMLVRGTLVKIYKVNSGQNSNGNWSIQNAELKDGTGTIKVMFKDREHPIPDTWKGRDIIIESVHGQKGYSGVYAFDDNYKGNNNRILKVTRSASVGLAEEHGEPDQGNQRQQSQQKPSNSGGGNGNTGSGAGNGQSGSDRTASSQEQKTPEQLEKEVKKAIMRDALLMGHCFMAANAILSPLLVENGVQSIEDTIQKMTSSLFISASYRKDSEKLSIPRKPKSDTPPASGSEGTPKGGGSTNQPSNQPSREELDRAEVERQRKEDERRAAVYAQEEDDDIPF